MSLPVTWSAEYPNSLAAVTDQQATRPAEVRVSTARPLRSGPCQRRGKDPPLSASCETTTASAPFLTTCLPCRPVSRRPLRALAALSRMRLPIILPTARHSRRPPVPEISHTTNAQCATNTVRDKYTTDGRRDGRGGQAGLGAAGSRYQASERRENLRLLAGWHA